MNRDFRKVLHSTHHSAFVREFNSKPLSTEQIEYEIEIIKKEWNKLARVDETYHSIAIKQIITQLKLNLSYLESALAERILLK